MPDYGQNMTKICSIYYWT